MEEAWSIVLFLLFSSSIGANSNEWTISPSSVNCTKSNCRELSYYLEDPSLYFSSNTILIFLEGVHYLNEPVTISGVSNLTLQGEGELQDGSHWTVRESTVKIICQHFVAGLFFVNWTDITINSITFENCGAQITGNATLVSDIKIHYSSFPYGWDFGIGLSAYHTLLFVNGSGLLLQSLTVQDGRGYGLTIANCYNISINESFFFRNNYEYLCNSSYDQFGGNIRISHLPVPTSKCPRYGVTESSIIINNTFVSFGVSQGAVINNKVYDSLPSFARSIRPLGGGIGLIAADYSCNRFRYELENIVAFKNYAFYSGANFALVFLPVPISITGMRSIGGYTSSHCGIGVIPKGSGLTFSVFNSLPTGVTSELSITGLESSHNIATIGAGLYLVANAQPSWNTVKIKSSNFSDNEVNTSVSRVINAGRSAIHIERKDIVDPAPTLNVSLVNVSVLKTVGTAETHPDTLRTGAVSLINIDCVISELVIADSSMIRGLALVSSRVFVQGVNEIRNNTALSSSGGGVQMDPHSYFIFQPPASLSFSSNHADLYGGGIYIHQRELNKHFRSPCFFQIDSPLPSPDVQLYADNNTANITGTFIAGGELTFCSFETDFFYSYCFNKTSKYCSFDIIKTFIKPDPDPKDYFFISSFPVSVSFCFSNSEIFNNRALRVSVVPGKLFILKLVARSETYGIAPGNIYSTGTANGAIVNNTIGSACSDISFVRYKPKDADTAIMKLTTDGSVPYSSLSYYPLIVTLSFDACPPFFQLVSIERNFSTCDCNSYIRNAAQSTLCHINTSAITTTNNEAVWMGYNEDNNCTFTGQCPFGYCTNKEVTFTINETDAQCALNRAGVLCGGCADGFSIKLGSNECGQCSDSYISLLLVFVVAGIALVAFLIILNLTVTVGTINGLIFYANIIKILEPRLFQTGPVRVLSQFISWINLDFGINVCFYDGMTPIDKIWWQFVFPIYIWIIIVVIILVVRFMTNHRVFEPLTRHIIHLKLVNVLATLLLLSYTKLIRTVFIILNRINLECDGKPDNRWEYDGTLEYAKGSHLPLFLFGLSFLCVVVIPYTLFLFCLPLIEKLPHLSEHYRCIGRIWLKLKPFTDAYASPFKDNCRFWVGFLVLIRLIVAGVYTADTDIKIVILSVFYIILFTLTLSLLLKGPYTNDNLNKLENWFLINLLGLFGLALQSDDENRYIIFQSFFLVTFAGIIAFHVYCRFKGCFDVKKTIKKVKGYHPFEDDKESSFIVNDTEDPRTVDTGYVSTSSVNLGPPNKKRQSHYRDSVLDIMDN